jgi:hypothetical protein
MHDASKSEARNWVLLFSMTTCPSVADRALSPIAISKCALSNLIWRELAGSNKHGYLLKFVL